MKLTKKYLKRLVLKEMRLMERFEVGGVGQVPAGTEEDEAPAVPQDPAAAEENPAVSDLKKKLVLASRNMTGILPNEIQLVSFLIDLIVLSKEANVARPTLIKRLELVKQEAEKLKK